MAQRRSMNRRRSSRKLSEVSGILNDDTNVIDNEDPLWFNRTSVRPSMSVVVSRHNSTLLNSKSSINTTDFSDKWYNNLTTSEYSKRIEFNAQKNNTEETNKEQEPTSESESEIETRKKRTKFQLKKKDKNETTNAFSKALEETTDSVVRKNVTHGQISDVNESGISNDSKTMPRLRPRIAFNKKKIVSNPTDKFDEIFDNTETEKISTKSSLQSTSKSTQENKKTSWVDYAFDSESEESDKTSKSHNDEIHTSKKSSTSLTVRNTKLSSNSVNLSKSFEKNSSVGKNLSLESESQISNKETENEDINTTSSKSKSDEHEEKSPTKRKSIGKNTSRSAKKSRNSIPDKTHFTRSRSILDYVDRNQSTNESVSKSNVSKTRSQLFKKKSQVDNENVFDQVLVNETSTDSTKSKTTSLHQTSKSVSLPLESDENDGDTSTMPKNIRRTQSRLFHKSKTIHDTSGDTENAEQSVNNDVPRNESRSLNRSQRKRHGAIIPTSLQSSPKMFKSPVVRLQRASSIASNVSSNGKENRPTHAKELLENQNLAADSEETPKSPKSRKAATAQTMSDAASIHSDDLLATPHPAHSTLNFQGKPLSRYSQFSFRNRIPYSPIPIHAPAPPPQSAKAQVAEKNAQIGDDEDVEVDVINTSDSNEICPLISRQAQDIPSQSNNESQKSKSQIRATENDNSQSKVSENRECQNNGNENSDNENLNLPPFLQKTPPRNKTPLSPANITEADLARVREKVNKIVEEGTKRLELEQQKRLEQAQKKARIDLLLKRHLAKAEAERKRKQRKPVDKAFLVDGKPYKQPRLPKPRRWVTNKLYDYFRKFLEPKYGLDTRIRSERLVLKLVDAFDAVTKRKRYENYEAELEDIMLRMAKYNIIETRHDFHRFCHEFMPSSFIDKAVPMMLPGNVRNIPFRPEILFQPIIAKHDKESKKKASNDSDD